VAIISVNSQLLAEEFEAWNVPGNYARMFFDKNQVKADRVLLTSFFFNDTIHLNNPRHLLAANAAFWSIAYREAENRDLQVEALAGMRALLYAAGSLGVGEITTLIHGWWSLTFALHNLPLPNFSASTKLPRIH
jgi:hypothetical protein